MFRYRTLLCFVVALAFTPRLRAQQPTPDQLQQLQAALASDPALAGLLRTRLAATGMTEDQIRARLRSAGYPDTLLNAYLPGADTTARVAANSSILNALHYLGAVDQGQQDSIAKLMGLNDTLPATAPVPAPAVAAPSTQPAPVYGLEIFRRSTSQFQPDLAGPVDATYRLGPHDVLALMVTGGIEQAYTLEVTREGYIVVPGAGQIYVANLTLEQANDLIFRRMRAVYPRIGRDPASTTKLFVTVARLRVNQVFVIGDVQAPGSYEVSGAGTILTALYAAGGPSDNGGLRDIQLRRGGKVISHFDLYRYLVLGDASPDQRLETGDVVFVPVHGPRVHVVGEVVRPTVYEVAPGETLADVIRLAGGFTAVANQRRIVTDRVLPPAERVLGGRDRTVVTADATSPDGNAPSSLTMVDGDSVTVLPVADKVRNLVTVSGAVWNPGTVAYRDGMRLSDALRLSGGVHPDVKGVQVNRLQSDQSRRELRAQFRDSLGTLVSDLALQEDDSITVYGSSDFRPVRFVTIAGQVAKPGKYAYREGMTLRDLLVYAGGLADGAYLDHAEVARLPDTTLGATKRIGATTFHAPLDSTYLFERRLDGSYDGPPGLPGTGHGAPETPLRAYDNVLILKQPDWEPDRVVGVRGEVQFPGDYTLRSWDERVTDVIWRAGGLTRDAYPAGAVLMRTQGTFGRVAVDIARALRDSAFRDNLVLQAGDTLYIPPFRSVVDVRGAVNSPITVAYVPGADLFYYINAAGGFAYTADRNRSYVQQPNGIVEVFKNRHMLPDTKPTPLPGAVVYVPMQDPNARPSNSSVVATVAQLMAAATTLVLVILRFK